MKPVVIVGGGIAGLAAAQRLASRGVPFTLLERDGRLGGKIVTERVGGFLLEGGPDCFLSSKAGGVALARALGIDGLLQGTEPAHRRAYVKRGGRLYPLPDGITGLVPARLGPLLTTRLLSPAGRIRAGCEAFIPRGGNGDESIAQFASRRFGREAYRWVVEPLLSGVFAGDGARLSLAATFPQLSAAERDAGGVLRAAWRSRRGGGSPSERGAFLSFPGGMEQLVRSLVARLPPLAVRTGARALAILRTGGGYRVRLEGRDIEADHVILATPAFASADLVRPIDADLAGELAAIPFVSTASVLLAYAPASGGGAALPPFPGSGYVCPRAEGSAVVAVTWVSNKFRDRAPAGGVLVRVFLGRVGDEGWADAPDADLIAAARQEVGQSCRLEGEPLHSRIFRWPRALPQYEVGHLDRVDRIRASVRRLPGLALAGASYSGVGIPDCISSGWDAADQVLGAGERALA